MIFGSRYTDAELISNLRNGGKACEKSLEYLYRRERDKVLHFVQTHGGNPDEAKDIFQDAMISLLNNIQKGKFDGRSAVSTYLMSICRHMWYKRFAKLRRTEDLPETEAEADLSGQDLRMIDAQKTQMVQQVLEQLKGKCRETLSLWAMHYSMNEIAEQLGFQNEQVARNKKSLCMSELKQLIQAHPALREQLKEWLEPTHP